MRQASLHPPPLCLRVFVFVPEPPGGPASPGQISNSDAPSLPGRSFLSLCAFVSLWLARELRSHFHQTYERREHLLPPPCVFFLIFDCGPSQAAVPLCLCLVR